MIVRHLQVHLKPADDDGHCAVRSHRYQEQRGILCMSVGGSDKAKQHGESSDGDNDGNQGEDEAVTDPIGDESKNHGEEESAGPWWDGVELCLNWRVAVGLDDGWGEVRVAVGRDDEAEVHETGGVEISSGY